MTNLKWIFISLFVFSAFSNVKAENTVKSMKDSIDENFVIASVLLAEPGGALYSNVGHVALRLQCPEHQLDYIFSYESEDVSQKILSFLAGKLKMGLFAIHTADYLNSFKQEKRGVKEYILNMPIETKRNLWRVCDNYVMEGVNLPYDYINRGCAYSTLRFLREGLDTIPIQFGPWPEKFQKLNRRELTELCMKDYPWSWCFMNLISNGSINDDCTMTEKVIMPEDLIIVLSKAKVLDNPLLSSPIQLLPSGSVKQKTWFTPTLFSVIILLLTIVASLYKKSTMDYVLLIIQSLLGVVTVYLIFFSDLVCTEWSWLIIPFNPLPMFLWKWRMKWSLPYAVIICIWALLMWLWPHSLTNLPYIVLALALVVSYISLSRTLNSNKI